MPDINVERKANKGEWSEIYAFFKILSNGRLVGADENLNPLPDKEFFVLKVVRSEREDGELVTRRYDLNGNSDEVSILNDEGISLKVVNLSELRNGVQSVFRKIDESTGSFPLPEAEKFMQILMCSSIKAASNDKTDIRLILRDRFSPDDVTESGFSIKTAYRSSPTLLNASGVNTSFIYKVLRNSGGETAGTADGESVRDRVRTIYQESGALSFLKLESSVFDTNLSFVDSAFPRILAAMLALYHRGEGSKIKNLTAMLPGHPDLQNPSRNLEFYEHNVKSFLEAAALGMTPATAWDGRNQANGGYIVVKDDGELACYHLYEREKFLDYLFEHTKFDSPSTTRHNYGSIERNEAGEEIIKLNLQIRFI